jgi:hypothetical protein
VHFDPGTHVGAFVVQQRDPHATALFDAVEGPGHDQVTLEGTYLSEGEPSGFSLSVTTPLLSTLTADYLEDDRSTRTLDAFGASELPLRISVGDDSFQVTVHPHRYRGGLALAIIRDESTGEELATVAAIPQSEGFPWVVVGVVVIVVVIVVTRHRENMRAIELCVPLDNSVRIKIEVPKSVGGGALGWDGETRVHKTDERA